MVPLTAECSSLKRKCASNNYEPNEHGEIKPSSSTQNSSDVYSRIKTTESKGRGSLTGWVSCPICCPDEDGVGDCDVNDGVRTRRPSTKLDTRSTKKYALGRGIAAHLNSVHTPWNPRKGELNRRERIRRRIKNLVYSVYHPKVRGIHDDSSNNTASIKFYLKRVEGESEVECYNRTVKFELGDDVWARDGVQKPIKWEPTPLEVQTWNKRVLDLIRVVEGRAVSTGIDCETSPDKEQSPTSNKEQLEKRQKIHHISTGAFVQPGLDRNGAQIVQGYKKSLPPFLKAAAEGNIRAIEQMVSERQIYENSFTDETNDARIRNLIEMRDRNGSTAEHWAAGGGHLACLKCLMGHLRQLRPPVVEEENTAMTRRRKRDGKTSLHYAARNGHNDIIDYLLVSKIDRNHANDSDSIGKIINVDVPSGDGTTPLHLAFYGGNLHTIKHLIEKYNANSYIVNEWGCGVGHWIAMSIHSDPREINRVLDYMKVSISMATTFDMYGTAQKQGHTAVHKAAQKLNKTVIRWLVSEAKCNWTDEQKKIAGAMDGGGNRPSDIWSLMGGDDEFMEWIKAECGW